MNNAYVFNTMCHSVWFVDGADERKLEIYVFSESRNFHFCGSIYPAQTRVSRLIKNNKSNYLVRLIEMWRETFSIYAFRWKKLFNCDAELVRDVWCGLLRFSGAFVKTMFHFVMGSLIFFFDALSFLLLIVGTNWLFVFCVKCHGATLKFVTCWQIIRTINHP